MTAQTEESESLRARDLSFMPWLLWIVASALGGVVIALASRPEDFLMHLTLRGLIVGTAQWLVVRYYLGDELENRAWWWILATGLGMSAMTTVLLLPPLHNALSNFYTMLYQRFGLWEVFWINLVQEGVLWGLVGIFQWFVLRRWIGPGLWIGLAILGGTLMGMTAATTCYFACGTQLGTLNLGLLVTDAAAWGVYGAVTGYGLWRVVRTVDTDLITVGQ